MVTRVFALAFVLSLVPPGAARAAEPPAPGAQSTSAPPPDSAAAPVVRASPRAALHHAPRSVATAHTDLAISATVTHPQLVRRAIVVYRRITLVGAGDASFREAEFLRGASGYVAVVPGADVKHPGLEYAVELELVDGTRADVFASRATPFRVSVSEDLMDVRERIALARVHGHRSVVSASFEYASFGRSRSASAGEVNDSFYRVEAAYTYRPLRLIDEFSVQVGAIRGSSPKPDASTEGTSVGLNYAAPSVRFRLGDAFRLETRTLASVTEVGFALGAGAALEVGDPYGSKWRIGFESIETFGNRVFSQVDIQASSRLRLSPIVEVTDMPHADRFGVRLVGEALYLWPNGFGVALRGGYQARDAASGGPSAGVRVLRAF